MLLAWQLPEKRGELLKLVESDIQDLVPADIVANETLYSAPIGEPMLVRCVERFMLTRC